MSFEESIRAAVRSAVMEAAEMLRGTQQPRLLSQEEAAAYLGCSISHIYNLRSRGVLTTVEWPGDDDAKRKRPYFDKFDLDRAIEQHKQRGVE